MMLIYSKPIRWIIDNRNLLQIYNIFRFENTFLEEILLVHGNLDSFHGVVSSPRTLMILLLPSIELKALPDPFNSGLKLLAIMRL